MSRMTKKAMNDLSEFVDKINDMYFNPERLVLYVNDGDKEIRKYCRARINLLKHGKT